MNRAASWRALTTKRSLLSIGSSFLQAFGVIALFLGVLDILFPGHLQGGLADLVAFAVASLVWAIVINWPQTTISRHFSTPDTTVTVKIGDLFVQDANFVIGMTDVFDTEKGDIINPRSIQAQFVTKVYGDDRDRLDHDIDRALHGVPAQLDRQKLRGKNMRYPIGTVAAVRVGPKIHFCIAYSRMDHDLHAQCTIKWLSESLDNLWEAVRAKGQRERVAMGVLGSDLARLGHQASHTNLITFIITSFILTSREKSVTKELVIVVHPSNADSVNFADLNDFLQRF